MPPPTITTCTRRDSRRRKATRSRIWWPSAAGVVDEAAGDDASALARQAQEGQAGELARRGACQLPGQAWAWCGAWSGATHRTPHRRHQAPAGHRYVLRHAVHRDSRRGVMGASVVPPGGPRRARHPGARPRRRARRRQHQPRDGGFRAQYARRSTSACRCWPARSCAASVRRSAASAATSRSAICGSR
jgi:hypothetical protein